VAVLTAGIDIGTSGVRAVIADAMNAHVVASVAFDTASGVRTRDGGHVLDDAAVIDAAQRALARACADAHATPAAISVAGAAGTLCFRDVRGAACAPAVAYDDARFGGGIERVLAWQRSVPLAARVIPITDAVLEALGADTGVTDWTNASKLGWDPRTQRWPAEASELREREFLPEVAPPGTAAGRCTLDAAPGALLARGVTDSCAMHIAAAGLEPGAWSVSLGTTVTWKAALDGEDPLALQHLPRGAYGHRLAQNAWLAAAAGNSGGGALSGDNLAALDHVARIPSGFAAYPLPRAGERFPVCDPRFPGFGSPHAGDPRRHAATLEGVAFVVRLGIEQLGRAGIAAPTTLNVTGGGANSAIWMAVLASTLDIPVAPRPGDGPALGAALLAAVAQQQKPLRAALGAVVKANAKEPNALVNPEPAMAPALHERYRAFTNLLQIVT
jgi:sugar (pentulose or hexulose) kinase